MITKTKTFCRSAKFSLLSLCGIAALSVLPQRACAALDAHRNVNFNITDTTPVAFATRYATAIGDIRHRVADGTIVHGVLRETTRQEYFTVHLDLNHGGVNERLGLVFRTNDLYIVGYYNPRNNHYYRIGDGPAVPMGYPAGFTAAQINRIGINLTDYPSAGYDQLQTKADKRRDKMKVSRQAFVTHARSLLDNAGITARSEAVLYFAQVFAEAARFDYISYRIEENMRRDRDFQINATTVALENDWRALSSNLLLRLDGQRPEDIRVPDLELNTIQRIAAELALCLMTQNSRRHLAGPPHNGGWNPRGGKHQVPVPNLHRLPKAALGRRGP